MMIPIGMSRKVRCTHANWHSGTIGTDRVVIHEIVRHAKSRVGDRGIG